MTGYAELLDLATTEARFMERYAETWFLMRITRPITPPDDGAPDSFEFKTVVRSNSAAEAIRWDIPLVAITKRPGNPFPDRISIGRAPNCDVVIRLPFVSKLHAHIVTNGSERTVLDSGSSRGTFLNGRRLPAHEPSALVLDDEISFGVQPTRVIDALRALGLLRRQSCSPPER